jgi:UDP-N-acetylmuramate dehydrogenase
LLEFQRDVSLKKHNTFGIDALAKRFADVTDAQSLKAWCEQNAGQEKPFLIGGGSNLLLTKDIEAPVLHIAPRGMRIVSDHQGTVVVEAMAGEPWHDFVLWTLAQGLCGLENLSLIPGYVGGAPVQNIGAYGVEIRSTCESVQAIEIATGAERKFKNNECRFGYRDSVFKQMPLDAFAIMSVRFMLSRNFTPRIEYGDITNILGARGVLKPTARDLSNAIITIRSSKLPDPAVIGNAGSFFKNPIVPSELAHALAERFTDMPRFAAGNQFKIPAGWLIEQTGWKGRRIGAAGVHEHHALVIVNHGGATGADIWNVAQAVQADVKEKFGIRLEPEPRVV